MKLKVTKESESGLNTEFINLESGKKLNLNRLLSK